MRLDTTGWKVFSLQELFGNPIRGTRITKGDRVPGNIPFITAGEQNEGVSEYVDNSEAITYNNALTIDMFGNCFYHSGSFKCDDNILVLRNVHLNYKTGNFIATVINIDKYRNSYGRQYRQRDYFRHYIKLPATLDGSPNWDYMESYMETLHYKPITTKNKKENIIPLHPTDWKKFRVGDLFVQERGAEAAPNQNEDGEVPIINETETNNGFVRNVVPTKVFAGNAITISINFARNVFYQPTDFCASVNIAIIRNKNLNAFNGLFIASVLRINNLKYSYGYKISKDKIDNTILKLPATPFGSPDWQFMESYIKSLPYGDRI